MGLLKNLRALFFAILLLGQVTHADEILVFAEDDKGNLVEKVISKQSLKESMVKTLDAVNTSVVKSVENKEFKAGGWQLKMFTVGLGLTGTIGIGPWDFGAGIKQRVIYAR